MEEGRAGNSPNAILGAIVLEPRRHREQEPLCDGPTALVVPGLPASRLRSIKRVLIDPSIGARMADAGPSGFLILPSAYKRPAVYLAAFCARDIPART